MYLLDVIFAAGSRWMRICNANAIFGGGFVRVLCNGSEVERGLLIFTLVHGCSTVSLHAAGNSSQEAMLLILSYEFTREKEHSNHAPAILMIYPCSLLLKDSMGQ